LSAVAGRLPAASTLRGVAWMSGAVLSFCAMALAARALLAHLPVFEILFFRTGLSLAIVAAMAAASGAGLATRHFGVHLWRNVFHLGGQASWVYALGALPLATVFAIEFTSPIWTALLAALLLGERLNQGRLVMLALGFAGVLVILRPGVASVQPAALVMLLGAFCFAVQMIGTKRLAATDTPMQVLFWMSLIQTPVALLAALPEWHGPSWREAPWIAVIGSGSFTAHWCLTRALKHADASVVVPVDYFRLPLIAVIGAAFYAEPFDPLVILGAALIFAGTWYSLARERL
jgi:drug/metabolite transporter (DMT)-like permease